MSFLRHYLRFEKQEMFVKFENEIAILTERSNTMGIEEFLLDRAEKKGIEKGLKEGVKKGRKEERQEVMRETALKMKKSGLDLTLIADITGLSVKEIEKLS
jgi:predicted transposase/invertase (TIGR01784 family)